MAKKVSKTPAKAASKKVSAKPSITKTRKSIQDLLMNMKGK